jgi:hypothetical protein
MLFALWTENRATEEAEGSSTSIRSSRHSGSVHSVSRQASVIMPAPIARLGDNTDASAVDNEKDFVKEDADESQGGATVVEDQRPLVFKSTFWEILCVASLVSAQLTNVSSQLNHLMIGTGTFSTNHDSCFNQILWSNNGTTSLGQRRSRNSSWIFPSFIRKIGGYIRSEACITRLSHVACCRRNYLWSKWTYV